MRIKRLEKQGGTITTGSGHAEKVRNRTEALESLRRTGQAAAAIDAARNLWEEGHRPEAVALRGAYLRHAVARDVPDDRRPPPRAERPPAARLITPRGAALRLHLTMLFAAQCQVPPGRAWRAPFPLEPAEAGRLSWMGLTAVHAVTHDGRGARTPSAANKRRQLAEALRGLADTRLVDLPRAGSRSWHREPHLLHESGASTAAAPMPYRVPWPHEDTVRVPVAFFTRGWVHLLTPSETVSYLMWLDTAARHGPEQRYVPGYERAGAYGLGRDAYESHRALEAFGLVEVDRPEGREPGGRFDFRHATSRGRALCHRVTPLPEALDRPALEAVRQVLHRVRALNDWSRPLEARTG
ncbi:hypothetical protein [Streptomyces sp. enrichment culture]|uniref:hypothetical protein n=1 Tax=Streptomyces sp. enrichment culture TaxID=1795815 RepID=UPI003F57B963